MNLNNKPVIKGNQAIYHVKDFDLATYQDIIQIRQLPHYKVSTQRDKGHRPVSTTIEFDASHVEDFYQRHDMPYALTDGLFDYQQVIVKVAYFKERYAIFADAGLGKTLVLWEIARQIPGKVVMCVPLNILRQFEEMVQEFFPNCEEFVHLHKHKSMTLKEWSHYDDVPRIAFINQEAFIKITSAKGYGKIDAFLLDEASILKGGQGGNGKISKNIIKFVQNIRYRYAASATPAPNDRTEYAMIAWFLGRVNSEKEFFTQYFTLQGNDYVLKKNAVKPFYNELASWSIFIRNPAAYGFEDNLSGLKPWEEIYQQVDMTDEQERLIHRWATKGKQMMLPGAPINPRSMSERGKFSQVSKGFYYRPKGKSREVVPVDSLKPQAVLDTVNKHRGEQILIWCVFDAEAEILERMIADAGYRVANIFGGTSEDKRIELIEQFRHGGLDVMISKPSILGFGLNFQFCRIAIFSGLDDSYEKYYQAVKRIHRYGQTKQVLIYHIYTQYEYVILANVLNKQKEMVQDFEFQERLYRESLYDELKQFLDMEDYRPMTTQEIKYEPIKTDRYQLYHGDSLEILTRIAETGQPYGDLAKNSIDLSVFSPPFMGDLFVYSNDPADMGNTRGAGANAGLDEFMVQMQFFLKGMLAVTKPGRLMAMHLEDVPLRKGLDGTMGLFDFVGRTIIEAEYAGWVMVAKIPILKNQQAQSIIKRIASLSMSNMETDRLRIAPCSNGYIVLFKKPGEALVPVADLAMCHDCGWSGYAKALNNWQPDRGYKSDWTLEPQVMTTIKDGVTTHADIEQRKREIIAKMEHLKGDNDFAFDDGDGIHMYHDYDAEEKYHELEEVLDNMDDNILWMTCPECSSNHITRYSEMNGNKWIMLAEGVWPDNGMDDYDTMSKIAQNKRWQDWIYTSLSMWPDINETDVLRSQWTKEQENADKHLCPLPYTVARRIIEMYSNPGELVLTPFLGIGTEAVEAMKLHRKAIGIELKPEYFKQAGLNVENAVKDSQQATMYELWGV